VNFRIRERNGAFGLAAPVGEKAGERTEQKAEWSGGFRNSAREPQRGSQVLPVWRRSLSRGSQSRQVLATGGNSLAVMAADSMLRRDHKAQAGNQRLHGQADFGAESESVPFEASSFKGNQTAQSRRRGDGLQTFWLLGAAQTWWYNFTHTATFSAQNRSSNTESVLRGLCDLLICCPLNVI
jgi:hypothetical protein